MERSIKKTRFMVYSCRLSNKRSQENEGRERKVDIYYWQSRKKNLLYHLLRISIVYRVFSVLLFFQEVCFITPNFVISTSEIYILLLNTQIWFAQPYVALWIITFHQKWCCVHCRVIANNTRKFLSTEYNSKILTTEMHCLLLNVLLRYLYV